ncbi:hypothetical protein [Kutzneria kofuensis]|uniref:Subtilase family serine protease n=1 Tax=Kutzneria kofuensis TaxID=103725 RepID=A0A7W9KDI6_9PSEU|nr:hypothetical protein [Kutzneria kofuensis]MBB5890193.1 subtilase family serine protease [Kutzneria kofuensis]
MRIVLAATLIAALAPTPATAIADACPPAPAGHAHCLAKVRAAGHDGYGPADLRSAYNLPATGGADQTVAVVDAGDDPNAEADLAVYRSAYGLPACTIANGCFRKVNQRGSADPLPDDQGWAIEIALDIQMVSAACPSCRVLLVEADDASFANLATAVNTAVRLGATEVSNSYGAPEQNGMQDFQAAYGHPGVAVLASSGDEGYGIPSVPAVFPTVVAVGGTSLRRAGNGWT